MTRVINTGNKTVDAVGMMGFTGNIIPQNWYKTILRDNKKPYLLAICILSEICYWYRPSEVRDEDTGYVIEYKKRFKEDLLQKSYQKLAEQFGESKRSIKAAMDRLEELGVIRRVWRNKTFSNGASITNILYISLNEERLFELTFNKPDEKNDTDNDCLDDERESNALPEKETSGRIVQKFSEKQSENNGNMHVTKFCNMISQNSVGGHTKECNMVTQNFVGGPTEKSNMVLQNSAGGPTENCNTYTKNTYENTKENTFNHIISEKPGSCRGEEDEMDRMNLIREGIKENISYESLIEENGKRKIRLDELVEIMTEIIFYGMDVCIGGKTIPYNVIKSKFDKYDYSVMEYVLETLDKNTTKIHNVKNYLTAALYNAPLTKDNYYGFEINHDMNQLFGMGEEKP